MKKLIYISLALALILTAANGISEAALSDNLVLVPEASIIDETGEVSADIILNDGLGNGSISGVFRLTPFLEAGVVVSEATQNNELSFDPLVKTILINEYNYALNLAAGLHGEDLYVVGSKTLGHNLKGHFGVGNGRFDEIFVGLSKTINTSSIEISEENTNNNSIISSLQPVKASIEFMNGNFNIGARSEIIGGLNAELSLINLDRFKASIGYSF